MPPAYPAPPSPSQPGGRDRQCACPLEPVGARKLLSASFQSKLPNAPPGEYVVLQYQTQADGSKTVVETVTPMKDKDGSWRVSGIIFGRSRRAPVTA